MWRVVLLVFCYHVVSQAEPATDDPSPRHTRELIECCPCPRSSDMLASQSRLVDDCPCRGRNADSDGASSMLFPARSGPGRKLNSVPFMRSNTPKDDVKNLLEPEVGLAASMLETLREATEEEYQDALARDAARDAVPEESRNVVIIVKPRSNDGFAEASNVKENRCIHPLGRARTASQPFRTSPNIFGHSKARQPSGLHLWDRDSNVGASNVQETVAKESGDQAPRSLFKFGTPLRDSLKSSGIILDSTVSHSTLKTRPNLLERLNLPLIPKMKVDTPLRKANNINTESPTPYMVQEELENVPKGLPKFNNRPQLLRNLLNLRDVEIIPKNAPKLLKSKLLNNELSLNKDPNEESDFTYDSEINDKVLMPQIKQEKENFHEQFDRREGFKNDIQFDEETIQDAFVSPSESIPAIETIPQTDMSDKHKCNDLSEEIAPTTTDSLSKVLQEDNASSENVDPAPVSEIQNINNNEEESTVSHETTENTDEENEKSKISTNSIENDMGSEETILHPELNQDTNNISETIDQVDESLSNSEFSEDHIKIFKPSPSLNKNDNVIPKTKAIPPITETLSTIRDNVKKTLENLKKNSINSSPTIGEKNAAFADIVDQEPIPVKTTTEVDASAKDQKEAFRQVTLNDLQKISNDLLILNSNDEDSITPKVEKEEQRVSEQSIDKQDLQEEALSTSKVGAHKFTNEELANATPCIFSDKNKMRQSTQQPKAEVQQGINVNDMSSEASAPSPSILPNLLDPLKNVHYDDDLGRDSLLTNINLLDPLNLNKKLGSINLDPLNIAEKLRSPILPDLDPLNLNEKLASPLLPILDPLDVGSALQDIIVPPTIQDDPLNLLAKPMTEVLKLPTLEDLREGLASVFNTNEKSVENNLSDEDFDCTDNVHEMASAASNTNFRVPSIKPLEDLNVDIFQINPLSSSQNIPSKVPRLNLNNFRTKLPIPTNLELKPVKLESRVGNNKGNILGASLTFGDKTASRKPFSQSNLFGQPLGKLPSLDELRNKLQSGTHGLIGSSPKLNLDLLRNSHLQSSGLSDIEEIRRNAEKTFKSLQQRMRSSLNVGGLNNPLNDKLANPQDLLEDVNDKLKAIHYDLNDRLSSIHEDLLDKSKLKPLAIPMRTPTISTGRSSNHKELNTFRKIKAKPSRLQTSASTISSRETDPSDNGNENNVLRSPSRNSLKKLQMNPQRGLVGAESSLIPTKVEPPIPRSPIDFPKKLLLTPLSQRLSTIRPGSDFKGKPLTLLKQPSLKDIKAPFLRKPGPFKDKTSKVTITFATTTPAPVTLPVESYKTTPTKKTTETNIQSSNDESLKGRLALPRPKSSELKPLTSESTPLRISTPSKNNFKTAISLKDLPHHQNTDPIVSRKPKILNHKGLRDDKLRTKENIADRLKSATIKNNEPEIKTIEPKIKPLVWPKSGEDSFLAKVREAMQARLASFDPQKSAKGNIEKIDAEKIGDSNVDMLKSASENNGVLVEAPLKESVPYKCRMMCTRE